jgi:biopolymer transport protein ExbB
VLEEGILSFALLGAGWVLWLLVILSVACIGVAIERAWFLSQNATDAGGLATAMNSFYEDGDLSGFRSRLDKLGGTEARILAAGAERADGGAESAERAMAGQATAERLGMERRLSFLATVGSNAPFIGLFGTVLGIIQAFHDLSLDTNDAQAAVMAGISEALVATAVGLLVAIPAVVLYNSFKGVVKSRMGVSSSLSDQFLSTIVAEARS